MGATIFVLTLKVNFPVNNLTLLLEKLGMYILNEKDESLHLISKLILYLQIVIRNLGLIVKKDKTCAPYVRNYEQSHLFRINVAWLLTLLPYQILLGVLGVFISHVPNFLTSALFSKSAAIILKTIVKNFLHMYANEIYLSFKKLYHHLWIHF